MNGKLGLNAVCSILERKEGYEYSIYDHVHTNGLRSENDKPLHTIALLVVEVKLGCGEVWVRNGASVHAGGRASAKNDE
jgi:hypothetical protein